MMSKAVNSEDTAYHNEFKNNLVTLTADYKSCYLMAVIILGRHLAAACLILSFELYCKSGNNNYVASYAYGKN